MTTLLLQLNNNNNKTIGGVVGGGEDSGHPPPSQLFEVFQATVVESSGGLDGGNGVFYERAVDDVIVVDADKRLFHCVRATAADAANGDDQTGRSDFRRRRRLTASFG